MEGPIAPGGAAANNRAKIARAPQPRWVPRFPFTLPVVHDLERLDLQPRCTFFVGENGSGKPTLLEAIAVKWGFAEDEPESALSPMRQMALFKRMNDLIVDDSQFIVAHSPTLLAYPDCWIYELSPEGIRRVAYEVTGHYQITGTFLQAPERYFRHLMRTLSKSGSNRSMPRAQNAVRRPGRNLPRIGR